MYSSIILRAWVCLFLLYDSFTVPFKTSSDVSIMNKNDDIFEICTETNLKIRVKDYYLTDYNVMTPSLKKHTNLIKAPIYHKNT